MTGKACKAKQSKEVKRMHGWKHGKLEHGRNGGLHWLIDWLIWWIQKCIRQCLKHELSQNTLGIRTNLKVIAKILHESHGPESDCATKYQSLC